MLVFQTIGLFHSLVIQDNINILYFSTNVRISFSISKKKKKKTVEILLEMHRIIYLVLGGQLGNNFYLELESS